MEDTVKIKGRKRGSLLMFERDGGRIVFDLRDMSFHRPLKSGKLRKLKSGQAFFRNLTATDVADGFSQPEYAELIRMVDRQVYRLSNFGSLFARLPKYAHLESYLLLGIRMTRGDVFNSPASQFPKEVLEFMKESQIEFDNRRWEWQFNNNPQMVTNLCTHVRRNHYLDLEVYRMVYGLVTGYQFEKYEKLVGDAVTEVPVIERRWNGGKQLEETPFGCEYKTLFDYLVMIDRTEALNFLSAMSEYYDYLKMMREMTRKKIVSKMKETNPNLDEWTIGWVGFSKIEKYPKYLRVRHDIVAKNYRAWVDEVNEKEFRQRVDYRYEFKKGKYRIVAPQKSDDIRNEGTSLHHCVASYVSRVMDGTTQILFLREVEDESLVTVEVRANAIVQSRGYNNRNIVNSERDFLKAFAKAKNLDYLDVKRNPNMPTPPIVALQKYDADAAMLRELSQLVRG